jgi:protein tyrosine phosphatase (PTP) superfamily phosphohydrolase (DUF442 family)
MGTLPSVTVYVSEEELTELKTLAKKAHLPVSAYCRTRILSVNNDHCEVLNKMRSGE